LKAHLFAPSKHTLCQTKSIKVIQAKLNSSQTRPETWKQDMQKRKEEKMKGEPGGFSHLLITFSRLKQIAGKLWCPKLWCPRLVVIKRLRRLKASAAQRGCLLLGFPGATKPRSLPLLLRVFRGQFIELKKAISRGQYEKCWRWAQSSSHFIVHNLALRGTIKLKWLQG